MKNIKSLIALILTVCLLGGGLCPGLAEEDIPLVILDTDFGVWNDDALALSLLIKAEETGKIRILGITLEGGNHFIDADYINYGETQPAETENIAAFLARAGREDIPVFCGTDLPMGKVASDAGALSAYYENCRYMKDSDDYGAVHFFSDLSSGTLTDSNDARDFLLASAKEYPGRVTVIAIGPVMNLARAVRADSGFAGNIAAVYYMAGAFGAPYGAVYTDGTPVQAVGGANITPFAEYNAFYDALSLETCMTAGFREQVFVPGEVNAPLTDAEVSRMKEANAEKEGLATAWLERYAVSLPDYPYWDPVTAVAFLTPENLRGETRYVTANTDRDDPRYAMTSALTEEEYALLDGTGRQEYGKAFVAAGYDHFWDVLVDLLCR